MIRAFLPLCVTLAVASALAQEPPPKPPNLPSLGYFSFSLAELGARTSCDGTTLWEISRSPFSVTGTTEGGEFESEIARHSCNQECRGATHEVCTPGSCYSVHAHEEGLKLKWEQTNADEITKKVSASFQLAFPNTTLTAGVEQRIKESITNTTFAELTLRGCVAEPCTIRTEAGGFLLKVNPGQVVITGYHTITVLSRCNTSILHWILPCTAGEYINGWVSTEITDIQFHGGMNLTFTKWLVPGDPCKCTPGHRTSVPPPSAPTEGKETPTPDPPRRDDGCGCEKKHTPALPRDWLPPVDGSSWEYPWPPVKPESRPGPDDKEGDRSWFPPLDGPSWEYPWSRVKPESRPGPDDKKGGRFWFPPFDGPSWEYPWPPVKPESRPGPDDKKRGRSWFPPIDGGSVPPRPEEDRVLPRDDEAPPKRPPFKSEKRRPDGPPPCDAR